MMRRGLWAWFWYTVADVVAHHLGPVDHRR
jgi:hypothetical protein